MDLAEKLFEVLKSYDIETVDKAQKKLPIIFECFEKEALTKFKTMSDLPLIYLMFWENPAVSYNLTDIATFAHGVGPSLNWLFKYSPADNSTYS